jgi:hypothetical protein
MTWFIVICIAVVIVVWVAVIIKIRYPRNIALGIRYRKYRPADERGKGNGTVH